MAARPTVTRRQFLKGAAAALGATKRAPEAR